MKDIIVRASKTFLQAFLGTFATASFTFTDFENLKSILISVIISGTVAGLSALISFLQNLALQYSKKGK